jgi:hypothetical protein
MAEPVVRRPQVRLTEHGAEELEQLLHLITGSDSVELKVSVPDSDRSPVLNALGIDPLTAVIRQIAFIDTPDLRLNSAGVIMRVRRTQQRPPDLTVKLRPVDPETLDPEVRRSKAAVVEVDASPTGFVCSCAVKQEILDERARQVLAGRTDVDDLLNRPQRDVIAGTAAAGVPAEDLRSLGPIHVLRARFVPEDFGRRMTAELWFLPDNTRMLELSTRCTTAEAFQVAAETRVYLARHGVDVNAPQDTKTATSLRTLAARLPEVGKSPEALVSG